MSPTEPSRTPAPEGPPSWLPERVEAFRSALVEFFEENQRELPWRRDPEPYPVLVSEVMLQQTRVDTMLPYFRRWMERFPTLEELAEAEQDEVLGLWQGLGYYSRARNLHRAAREVSERYGGHIPEDPQELRTLPGVGPYTAGAVASIAFGVSAPAVDGNVRRVLARLMNHPEPPGSLLREWASALVPSERPGTFNQALMELGSLVCTPRKPSCERCPLSAFCLARSEGTQECRPRRRRRAAPPFVREAVAVLSSEGVEGRRVLLRRRGDRGLLAGMWELPGRTVEVEGGEEKVARALATELLEGLGGDPVTPSDEVARLSVLDHAFSHRKVRYFPFLIRTGPVPAPSPREETLRWVVPDQVDDLPIPAAQRKLLGRLSSSRRD